MTLNFVLVRTEGPANIGSAARALANLGGQKLILIDPKCEIDESTRQMAAGAQAWLNTLTIYKSWDEFYAREEDGLRIALSRRAGRKRRVFPLRESLRELKRTPRIIYLILGPEANGLDATDLAFANRVCHLPIYGDFASLNLAQAALLAGHLVRDQFPPEKLPAQTTGEEIEPVAPMYFPDQRIKEWLEAMGFSLKARKASAYLTLRRLFLQNQPTRHEMQVLDAVLQQNIRKLKAKKGEA